MSVETEIKDESALLNFTVMLVERLGVVESKLADIEGKLAAINDRLPKGDQLLTKSTKRWKRFFEAHEFECHNNVPEGLPSDYYKRSFVLKNPTGTGEETRDIIVLVRDGLMPVYDSILDYADDIDVDCGKNDIVVVVSEPVFKEHLLYNGWVPDAASDDVLIKDAPIIGILFGATDALQLVYVGGGTKRFVLVWHCCWEDKFQSSYKDKDKDKAEDPEDNDDDEDDEDDGIHRYTREECRPSPEWGDCDYSWRIWKAV
jgi:hypothetical protein